MKILLSVENFYPRLGGGEVFMDELMTELSKKHECKIIYAGIKKPKSTFQMKPIHQYRVFKNIPFFNRTIIRQYVVNHIWKRILEQEVKKFRPDLILTQLEYVPASIEVAKKYHIKTGVFIQNYDHFCPFIFKGKDPFKCSRNCFKCSNVVYKIQFPFVKMILDWHRKALKEADFIFSDSDYVKRVLKQFYGVESTVLHPILCLDDFKIKNKSKGEYITFINPIGTKGVDIVYKIAQHMKEDNFLIIGGADKEWISKFDGLVNVKYAPWVDDMELVYSKTRILLVPSTWPEPFGRVVLEAQINGIPVISSGSGGLPEAVGDGGLVINDLFDIKRWLSAINKISEGYLKYSKEAENNSMKFTKEKQMKLINQMLISLTI